MAFAWTSPKVTSLSTSEKTEADILSLFPSSIALSSKLFSTRQKKSLASITIRVSPFHANNTFSSLSPPCSDDGLHLPFFLFIRTTKPSCFTASLTFSSSLHPFFLYMYKPGLYFRASNNVVTISYFRL